MVLGWLLAVTLTITPTAQEITIDGRIDEPAWEQALIIEDFVEMNPGDNVPPPVRTVGYATYDREHLYIAFRCYDPNPKDIKSRYTDRDGASGDDFVALLIDTFNDERRAYFFETNALGVQMDATFLEPVGYDYSWDTVWASAGRLTDFGFEVEMAIPFKSIRFPNDKEQVWGFTLERYYPRETTHRIVSHTNDRNRVCWLCLDDELVGLRDIQPGKNIEVIPAITGIRTDERPSPVQPMDSGDTDIEGSLTATWGITSNLTLNGTLNPDFSQVEADAFQLNINQRFALYYDEKRPFFMEGSSYFNTPLNAVYTRSIAEPSWGLKLTGKEGKNGYGILVARDDYATLLIPGVNGSYSIPWNEEALTAIGRYQRDFGEDSTIGGIWTYRSAGSYSSWLAGADGRIRLSQQDEINFQVLQSGTTYPDTEDLAGFHGESVDGGAYYLHYQHFTREWTFDAVYQKKDEEFRADLGYIPRVGDEQHVINVGRRWYGGNEKPYTMIFIQGAAYQTLDPDRDMLDRGFGIFSYTSFPWLQSSLNIGYDLYDESFEGIEYPDRHTLRIIGYARPAKWLNIQPYWVEQKTIDYVRNRSGDGNTLGLDVSLRPGKRLQLGISAEESTLDVQGGRLYTARLLYLSTHYFFTSRLFFRGILQKMELEQNPGLYASEVSGQSEQIGTQFLLSYRVNPFTLVYLGYSDFGMEDDWTDPTTLTRTYFVKLSYAWRP